MQVSRDEKMTSVEEVKGFEKSYNLMKSGTSRSLIWDCKKLETFNHFSLSLTWNSEVRNISAVFWHQTSDGDSRVHDNRGDW